MLELHRQCLEKWKDLKAVLTLNAMLADGKSCARSEGQIFVLSSVAFALELQYDTIEMPI